MQLKQWARCFALFVAMAVVCVMGHAQQIQLLTQHVPLAVQDRQAVLVGAMAVDQQMNVSIVLPLRDRENLTALLGRLYDPSSPDYRHFLSVAEFTEQFGPTVSDYQAVVAFARAHGLEVTDEPANRLVVPVRGTVAQIDQAFNVLMNTYQHPTEDRTFFSPDREPSLNLGVHVAHIAGLNNFYLPHPMLVEQPQGVLSATATGSGPGGAFLGSDMRAAYYGGTTLDGNGQVVGLLEFAGYNLSDVNLTFSNAGQSYSVPVNNVLLDNATGAPSGSDAEEVLDIVQAIAMAPGLSQVRVYIGGNDATILNKMASENLAKQIGCSWSWRPDDPTVADVFFQEFAAQGQSFFTASGDDGAFYAALSPYFYPTEDVYVTSVGGTHLTTSTAGGGGHRRRRGIPRLLAPRRFMAAAAASARTAFRFPAGSPEWPIVAMAARPRCAMFRMWRWRRTLITICARWAPARAPEPGPALPLRAGRASWR